MERKVVLITGASRGIGAAIAKVMAAKNYDVVINYLNSHERAESLKKEIVEKYNVNVLTYSADVSEEESVKNMVEEVIKKFGYIDCLVNNAAISRDNYFEEKDSNEFKNVVNTNLVGTYLMCKFVGVKMLENKNGRIINISSTNAIDTNETFSMDYDASKAGVISLTRNFAKILSPYVQVNTIAPGWTKTEPVLEMNPNYIKEEEEKILLKRFAEPEEIANVVAFLASDDASYINNSIIRVDGGI